ncbi:MAG: hypothetical protein KatS3mg110_2034 [Pirellulaceae bacterium]|nr:MAG: hypothetical protein KatS3mg110_2034 [Pirellulaceae bacterium]
MQPTLMATGGRNRPASGAMAGICAIWLGLVVGAGQGGTLSAQQLGDRAYPPPEYFLAKQFLLEGDWRRAAQAFQSVGRSGFRYGAARWIDSICYHAMLGESYYQMGELPAALEQFNAAVALYLASPGWLNQVQFTTATRPPTYSGPPIPWGQPQRPVTPGAFPSRAPLTHPALANVQVTPDGGLLTQPQFVTMHIAEIARCLALSLRRRAEILGPLGAHDPLSSRLIAALSARPAPPGHWSQAWVDCWLGLAYAGANRWDDATTALQKSLTAGGFEHELSGIALLELGKLAAIQGQWDQAASLLYEATFRAVLYEHYDVLEEAFRWGAWSHRLAGRPGVYPVLAGALAWAQRQKLRQLEVSLLIESAEQAAVADPQAALALLDRAQRGMLRSPMLAAAIGARHRFVTAQVQYRLGKPAAAEPLLASALAFYRKSAPQSLQVALAPRTAAGLTDLAAHELYETVLREPTPLDWSLWPAETTALLSIPDVQPWVQWFELAIKRGDLVTACQVTDRIRRRQFLASQPLGGRILALRWLVDAPSESLTDTALLQRQDLFARWPILQELSQKSNQYRQACQVASWAALDNESLQKLQTALAEWMAVAGQQEAVLWQVATDRQPGELVFPPLIDVQKWQQQIPEKTAVWMFFTTDRELYSFLIRRDAPITGWRIPTAQQLRGQIAELLKTIGNVDAVAPITAQTIAQPWQPIARTLYMQLADQNTNSAEPPWKDAEELVIVPDGVLWYLPFEILMVGAEQSPRPLISTVRLRYAPLLALASPDRRPLPGVSYTALVSQKLHPQEPDTIADQTATEFKEVMPNVLRLPNTLPGSTALAALLDRAVVLQEIQLDKPGPLAWAPLPVSGRSDASLADWFALPWGAPAQLIVPGMRTVAEEALRRGGTGQEFFLAACGLAASGTRTALISRWRVGGRSARQLVREFLQELPHRSAAEAWQRSVQVWQAGVVDIDAEPRLDRRSFQQPPDAGFPFFWAGYLLLDSGAVAATAMQPPADKPTDKP